MKRASVGALLAALVLAVPAHATFPGDNGRIAFTWSVGGEAFEVGPTPQLVGIVSVRPNGRDRRIIAPRGRMPVYSPNGREIAFLRSGRVWVARASGANARPVTPRGWSVGDHQWSPGGTRLAFGRTFRNSGGEALYTVRRDGTGLTGLLKTPLGLGLSSGAWSPNGKAIVYDQSSVGPPLVRIFRGGEITTLARPAFESTWSRRGLIAYQTPAEDGRSEVCVQRPDPDATPSCVGFGDASVSDPSWSPDGRRLMIVYTAQGIAGDAQIWTVRPDGTVLTRMTQGNVFPLFSPDGELLAFNRSRFAGRPPLEYEDLFVTRPDGTGMRRVVRGGQVNSPDWQPLPAG